MGTTTTAVDLTWLDEVEVAIKVAHDNAFADQQQQQQGFRQPVTTS